MEVIEISTRERSTYVDITQDVQQVVNASKIKNGIAAVYSLHTTGGVTVNENADPDVMQDVLTTLNRLVPRDASYAHTEGNSDAHVKASLIGFTVTVPVDNGQLILGTWQGIYFCEFDGPRRRRIAVQVVGS